MSIHRSIKNDDHIEIDTEEREEYNNNNEQNEQPIWCPEKQIYIDGIVPGNINNEEINNMIKENNGKLRIFGYGSLCWNPGQGAILSREGVTTTLGRAIGYKRCWAQKSTDHRGIPNFPGIVCTLLSDNEVNDIIIHSSHRSNNDDTTSSNSQQPTLTEGLIYTVPSDLVDECLAELDFREKGGYARDVINVIEDDSGNMVKSLLYRGTPDNPAFWTRALLDLPFTAAVISTSIGPSGNNDEYLYNLDNFLSDAASKSEAAAVALKDHVGDNDTGDLATMCRELQEQQCQLFFLFGSGSNQHNQLLLSSPNNVNGCLINDDETHQLTEIVLCTTSTSESPSSDDNNKDEEKEKEEETGLSVGLPKQLFAGGGHSGLLIENGKLYLWGWNEYGQLGRSSKKETHTDTNLKHSYFPIISELPMKVEVASLGFSHTIIIEKDTGYLFAFGDNSRGQVSGGVIENDKETFISEPVTPPELKGLRFIDVSAGLFHSAAIDDKGRLVTFGCGKFGQTLSLSSSSSSTTANTTKPLLLSSSVRTFQADDGVKFVRVVCGRRHTVIVDEYNRIWSMGENKCGQLGRSVRVADNTGGNKKAKSWDSIPKLVDGDLGMKNLSRIVVDVECGWSHNIVAVSLQQDEKKHTSAQSKPSITEVYGWGRNDKGQLGTIISNSPNEHISEPTRVFTDFIPDNRKNYQNNNMDSGPGSKSIPMIQSVVCGSECTMIVDWKGNIYGCGWNEHGNLSLGYSQQGSNYDSNIEVDVKIPKQIIGAKITKPPTISDRDVQNKNDDNGRQFSNAVRKKILIAAGGAHFICCSS